MTIRTLLFDFDYTLADSSIGVVLCFEQVLTQMGQPVPLAEAIRATIGLSLEESYRVLTGDETPAQARRFHQLFVPAADQFMVANTRLLPRVPEALALLHTAGYQMGVLSTKYSYRIVPVLQKHAIDRYFQIIMGGDHVTTVKPHPEGILTAMQRLGATAETTLYIGDSPTDARASHNAGVRFCAVLSGVTPRAELQVFAPWLMTDDVYTLAQSLTGAEDRCCLT